MKLSRLEENLREERTAIKENLPSSFFCLSINQRQNHFVVLEITVGKGNKNKEENDDATANEKSYLEGRG